MTDKTLAAVLVAPNQFEVQEVGIPDIPDDAGLLKVEACGICGSDARIRERTSRGPVIMGHENVGTIARLGKTAAERWGLKEGDRVALEEYVTCGSCRWCRSKNFRYCWLTDSAGAALRYGSTPTSVWPSLWGGYSEYLYIHPGAVIHKMPEHVPAELATPFLPLANGIELACGYGGVGLGDSILIQGPGEHGIAAVMAAKAAGAGCIIAAGLTQDESRLEICKRLGAHVTVDVEKQDLAEAVRNATGGEGVDVVLNITGAGTKTAEQSLACAAKVATIVLSDAGNESIDLRSFGRRELTIKSSNGHSFESVEKAIQMIASGDYPIAELTAPAYTLDQASQAVDAVAGLIDRSITFATILPKVGSN